MENKKFTNPQDIQIQGLLDRYLHSQASNNNASAEKHLNEDLLAAFTEGNLNEREAQPIINHLVDCSFCRHVTAELVRLDLALTGENAQIVTSENQPSKISEVLTNLFSRIFGANDDAVFAHQENEDHPEAAECKKSEEK